MAEPLDHRIQLVVSKSDIDGIDQWIREQPRLMSRSAAIREAIRRLIERGLRAEAEERKRG